MANINLPAWKRRLVASAERLNVESTKIQPTMTTRSMQRRINESDAHNITAPSLLSNISNSSSIDADKDSSLESSSLPTTETLLLPSSTPAAEPQNPKLAETIIKTVNMLKFTTEDQLRSADDTQQKRWEEAIEKKNLFFLTKFEHMETVHAQLKKDITDLKHALEKMRSENTIALKTEKQNQNEIFVQLHKEIESLKKSLKPLFGSAVDSSHVVPKKEDIKKGTTKKNDKAAEVKIMAEKANLKENSPQTKPAPTRMTTRSRTAKTSGEINLSTVDEIGNKNGASLLPKREDAVIIEEECVSSEDESHDDDDESKDEENNNSSDDAEEEDDQNNNIATPFLDTSSTKKTLPIHDTTQKVPKNDNSVIDALFSCNTFESHTNNNATNNNSNQTTDDHNNHHHSMIIGGGGVVAASSSSYNLGGSDVPDNNNNRSEWKKYDYDGIHLPDEENGFHIIIHKNINYLSGLEDPTHEILDQHDIRYYLPDSDLRYPQSSDFSDERDRLAEIIRFLIRIYDCVSAYATKRDVSPEIIYAEGLNSVDRLDDLKIPRKNGF